MYKIVNFSQNLKALVFRKYALLLVLLCLFSLHLMAQEKPVRDDEVRDLPALPTQEGDTLNPETDPTDTLRVKLPDQTQPQAQGDITTTIKYNAKDSILFDAANRIVYLYGDAVITYGDINLKAARITIDWTTSTLTAVGVKDSLNKDVGTPVFTQGAETYVTDNIRYNFKDRKAVIRGIVTQQQEAYIHGDVVKKDDKNQLYIRGARYTTCNLEHPHFYIEAGKLKLMPNDKIVSGPFHLKIADISTPLGFLFGMFPAPRKRVSGVIMPSYGEESRRGFFLRDGGYYVAVSDFMDLALTGEIYTKGSRGFQIASNYRNRYNYSGNFSLRYNRQNLGNEGEENLSRDFWVTWSHNPESKGNSRFSASVNAGTTTYTQNNFSMNNFERNQNQQFSSSINYSNSFPGTPFNFSARASLVQDIVRKSATILLPDVSLNMQRQYPFRPRSGTAKTWWQQINFSYTGTATNRISNRPQATSISGAVVEDNEGVNRDPIPLNINNFPQLLRNADNGVKHTIPVSTTLNVLKHFSLSPSFNYQELWYFRRLKYLDYTEERGAIGVETENGFNRAATYNMSAGLTTKVYGFFYFNKKNPTPKVQAIRHMIIPSVSFSFAPDFSKLQYGNFQTVSMGVDQQGDSVFQQLSRYQGYAYGAPQAGRQGSIGINITNNFEMKVREKGDTATTYKKVPLLERLSISTSYNMLKDSLKLAPINISGNTSLFNNLVMLNFGGTLNPYSQQTQLLQRGETTVPLESLVDQYAIALGEGLGKLTQVNVGLSTSLSSEGIKGKTTNAQPVAGANINNDLADGLDPNDLNNGSALGDDLGQEGLAYRYTDPTEYVDFTLPWTLRLAYTLNYSNQLNQSSTVTQSVNFSGDLKVTEKWKVGYTSGYDIKRKDFTTTRLSIYRDLHCWQMNVNWVPFGYGQSFSVDIRVKAAILQDLKLSRRRSFWDN